MATLLVPSAARNREFVKKGELDPNRFKLNAVESAKLSAVLIASGISRSSHRTYYIAVWELAEAGSTTGDLDAYQAQIAGQAGKSLRWVQEIEKDALAAGSVVLVEKVSTGRRLCQMDADPVSVPSHYDLSGMRAMFDALAAERPVNLRAMIPAAKRAVSKVLKSTPELARCSTAATTKGERIPLPAGELALRRIDASRKLRPEFTREERRLVLAAVVQLAIELGADDDADPDPEIDMEPEIMDSQPAENVGRLLDANPHKSVALRGINPIPTLLCGLGISPENREKEKSNGNGADIAPSSFTVPNAPSSPPAGAGSELQRATATLDNVRPTPGGYLASCPCHDDEHPSLKVSSGATRPLVVHCFAGCRSNDVLAELNRRMASGHVGARTSSQAPRGAPIRSSPKGRDLDATTGDSAPITRVVAHYFYPDKHRAPAHRVTRVLRGSEREFWQYHWRAGSWTLGEGPHKRGLYNAPELANADPSAVVLLVEGERDADALRNLGLLSTTSGSATSWRPELRRELAGRRVVVIPDADAPGRRYAEQVRASLAGIAASCIVLDLWPGADDGRDVPDWLDAGHSAHELRDLLGIEPALVVDFRRCDECDAWAGGCHHSLG